ncbi:MAG: flagellar biosynthesis protein FlhF [Pseudomonadota bacterium]
MQVKRYEAVSMREAMTRIKHDLGPDAVILSTKKISKDKPLIEITAARDRDIAPAENHRISRPDDAFRYEPSLGSLRQEIRDLKSCIDGLAHHFPVTSDCSDLKEALNILCDTVSVRNALHLHDIYLRLIANGVSRIRALRLIETIKNDFPPPLTDTYEKAAGLAEKLIAGSFLKDEGKEKRIKAFIGPTGVGKTTTLAKLAAHYCLEKKMKVGLITTDTYRIAASEQLKIYAKIMGLPIDIASSRDKFSRALSNFAEKDMIFVDTPGRNHHDNQCLKTLKSILTDNIETFLLLSPIASREYLLDVADRFRMFHYDRIILTKLDECTRFGSMVDVLDIIAKPVSYVTTGQNVPRDIERTNPDRLAKLTFQSSLN